MRRTSSARAQFMGAGGCGHSTVGSAVHAPDIERAKPFPRSPNTEKPVDLVHLAKQSHGDRALEEEVLGLFLNQTGLYMARLAQAGSREERSMAAHAIRGSALAIGAWDVARMAKAIELGCDTETDQTEYDQLSASVLRAQDYIRDLLK